MGLVELLQDIEVTWKVRGAEVVLHTPPVSER